MKKLFFIIALATSMVASAQSLDYYLYHGKHREIQINDSVLLVYFDASQIDTATIHYQYECLRAVQLDPVMAETLIAYEISISGDDYDTTVNRLRQLPEVNDVEPVIGLSTRVPVSNVFYVRLNTHDDTATLKTMVAQSAAIYRGRVSTRDTWYAVEVNKESMGNALALSTIFGESGLFADVDPGFIFELHFNTSNSPDDPGLTDQWAVDILGLCDIWDAGFKGTGINIAIMDDGIDLTHSEFSSTNIVGSFDSQYPYCNNAIRHGVHGTFVAGVIFAAHNSSLIAGVAPDANLINISFYYHDSMIVQNMDFSIMKAYEYALNNNADVILCAWDLVYSGANTNSSMIESAIEDALENGRNGKGAVVVFASGRLPGDPNDYNVAYPANFDDRIIVVGGSTENRNVSSYSRYGNKLDIVAPGEMIYTTIPLDYYTNIVSPHSGSSMAAAHVAGIAALMLEKDPDLTNAQVEWIMKRSATKFPYYTFSSTSAHPVSTWNNELGYGEIHAMNAIRSIDSLANYHDLVCIKDFSTDNGTVPSNLSNSVNTSPSIKIYNSLGQQTTTLYRGSTYSVKITIHNLSYSNVNISPSSIHVFCRSLTTNMIWNSSFTVTSTLSATGSGASQIIVPGGSYTFSIPLAIPTNYMQGAALPVDLTFLAYVGDATNISDLNRTNAPLEGFVRWNSRVAMRTSYSLGDDNVLPPIGPLCITSVSPNPATGSVVVEYQTAIDGADVQLLLTNTQGVPVIRTAAANNRCRIDISALPAGQYQISLLVNGVVQDAKPLIVQ